MLITMQEGKFPTCYVPTVFDNSELEVSVEGQTFKYSLWDTAGAPQYKRIRALSYPHTDLIILVFSVVNHGSYEAIKGWCGEVRAHCPHTKILLLGSKTDLRNDSITLKELGKEGKDPLSEDDGIELAEEIGAIGYLECSAVEGKGLKELTDSIVQFFHTIITHQDDLQAIENYRTGIFRASRAKSARK